MAPIFVTFPKRVPCSGPLPHPLCPVLPPYGGAVMKQGTMSPTMAFRSRGRSVLSDVLDAPHSGSLPMMDELYQFFARRPAAQRAFLAFTVALFLACAAKVSIAP